ncbi:asparaginase [Roseivivax isoporae]|uniref:L-asparaginase II n=1 Tax=Roseivivax isoporae LMG 25204 TaxID=1449351 RepID=X7F716_9RHOB|nr:asparaginase [Roseivivax isoporae]ETX28498.1 L-asparaginase II [Roseivivax isoporae LMG 25204]
MSTAAVPLVEVWRGSLLESVHCGHVAISDARGEVVEAWGDPDATIFPRSSAKMIQALPLVASGAAARAGLSDAQLALSCGSHQGAPVHVDAVSRWLAALGLREEALRCGPEASRDKALRLQMIRDQEAPTQLHNNCSGKHAGFLTLARHLEAGPEYVDPDHPVQRACLEAFETVTDRTSPGFGIDGCSAPNWATPLAALARAMAVFATAHTRDDVLSQAAARLTRAMQAHPVEVAGEGRACTLMMRAARERLSLKTGAEGVFAAILPDRGLGIALKIADGATRASECAIAAILVRLGVLDAAHPDVARFLNAELTNRRGLAVGDVRPVTGLAASASQSLKSSRA